MQSLHPGFALEVVGHSYVVFRKILLAQFPFAKPGWAWRRGFRSAPGSSHRSSFAFAANLNRAQHPPGQPRQRRCRLGWRAEMPQSLNDGSRTPSDSVLGLISSRLPAGVSESLHIG
jgi:hypothetical protein